MLWLRYGPLMAELMVKCPRYETAWRKVGKGERNSGAARGGITGICRANLLNKGASAAWNCQALRLWALRGRETQESPRVKWREKVLWKEARAWRRSSEHLAVSVSQAFHSRPPLQIVACSSPTVSLQTFHPIPKTSASGEEAGLPLWET